MSLYKTMPKGPTVSFNQDAKRAADLAALAERRAAGDPSQLEYVDPEAVMKSAFKQSPGVRPGSLPSSGVLPSTIGANYTPNPNPNAQSFSDYFPKPPDFFAEAGSNPNYHWPASYAPLPAGLAGLKVPMGIGQTKPIQSMIPKLTAADFAARAKAGLLNDLPTGGNSHRRSALKAKRSRRSASGKRCRRKGKRSRKAHRR